MSPNYTNADLALSLAATSTKAMTPLLSNMSPDDMRIAMALLDGWTEVSSVFYDGLVGRQNENSNWGKPVPDYLNSLDAVAPVEAQLTDSQREHVIEILIGDAERPLWKQVADAAFATALQRTKAILLAAGKATLDSSPPSP